MQSITEKKWYHKTSEEKNYTEALFSSTFENLKSNLQVHSK